MSARCACLARRACPQTVHSAADLDWCGFFAYSPEEGTYAADLDGRVPEGLMAERLGELRELQDASAHPLATRRARERIHQLERLAHIGARDAEQLIGVVRRVDGCAIRPRTGLVPAQVLHDLPSDA